MKKICLVASLVLLGSLVASTVFADSINYSTGPVPGATVYDFESNNLGVLSGTYTLGSLGVITNTSGSIISNRSDSDGAEPAGDTTKYLSVKGDGSTTITFSNPNNHYFGLYWGSIDLYNTITFSFATKSDLSYTGFHVTNPVLANGNQQSPGTNKYVNFNFSDAITAVTLKSGSNSFEVDNLAIAPVPEPATMLLFGVGLTGLAVARRKKVA